MMGVLSYMVDSVGLYGGDCWVTWWRVGLHDGGLGYMVMCWVTWWVLFGSIMGSVGLNGGECWVTWWRVLG